MKRNKLLLILVVLLSISLVEATYPSLAPYEMHVKIVGEYMVDYIIYYPSNASWLFEHIESEDIRYLRPIDYPNYSLSEVGENYYIDTWISPVGRMYHTLMYGDGWVLDASVYKTPREDKIDYKVNCKEKGKIKIKRKCHENKS